MASLLGGFGFRDFNHKTVKFGKEESTKAAIGNLTVNGFTEWISMSHTESISPKETGIQPTPERKNIQQRNSADNPSPLCLKASGGQFGK